MNGLELLERQIKSHPFLKVEDHQVVSQVCDGLRIVQSGYVTEYLKVQVELEAATAYLVGRYGERVDLLQGLMTERRAGVSVALGSKDDEGYRWRNQDKEEYLLTTSPEYFESKERLQKAERLLSLLRELREITFRRDRKLEQISNNYRQELRDDSRYSS